jgi:acyl-CoA synthetase (AMP-forming)/AMP-acid ligase II
MPNVGASLTRSLTDARPVLIVAGRATTARALASRLGGLTLWLRARGVVPGDRVVVLVPPGPELVASVLAVLRVGAVAVLADPDVPLEVFNAQMRWAKVRWVVADPRLAAAWHLPGLVGALLRRAGVPLPPRPRGAHVLALPRQVAGLVEAVPRDDEDEAVVLFTSGTTAEPRGVVHSHGSLAALLDAVRSAVSGLDFSSYVAETPPQLFYGLALGAVCHVAPGRGPCCEQELWRLMETGEAEAWFGSPWLWTRWLAGGRRPPSGLRALVLGSAPVTPRFLSALLAAAPPHLRVLCLYGLTEAGPVATVDGREKAAWTGAGDLVGHPVPGTLVAIRDGRVHLQGPTVAPRYLGQAPGTSWLDTGDLGCLGPSGLVLLGRAKEMILRRGHNIYPGLLEPLLARSLGDVALVGVFDSRAQDERVVLAWAGSATARVPSLGEADPDHLLPLPALPRRGRQLKVDRGALRRMARARFDIPE